ncbi:hypothetical protein ACFOU2_21765 [Bacillus songklensis]|uniref:YjzC-like protein n=1 Tax=Bacillus songklensis TaxID=1069116 RepID=A0ABV8B9Y4_9BACI
MENRDRTFKTGESVSIAGEYESEAGKKMQYKEGDLFEACPATGNNTNWRRCLVQ